MAKKLYGTNPDQVPTNADLGTMAYQDKDNVSLGNKITKGAQVPSSDTSASRAVESYDGLVEGVFYNSILGSNLSKNAGSSTFLQIDIDDDTSLPVDDGTTVSVYGSMESVIYNGDTTSSTSYTNYAPIVYGKYSSVVVQPDGGVSSQRLGVRGASITAQVSPPTRGGFLGTADGFLFGLDSFCTLSYTANGLNFSNMAAVRGQATARAGNADRLSGVEGVVSTRFIGNTTYGNPADASTFGDIFGFCCETSHIGSQAGNSVTIDRYAGLNLSYPTVYSTGLTINDDIYGIYVSGSSFTNRFGGDTQLFPDITTSASAANVYMDTGNNNRLYVSTSSADYKTAIEDLDSEKSDAILGLRPVWYRSTAAADPSEWSYYGLIAEEVAEIEPRLVHYGYKPTDYEEITVSKEVRIEEDSPDYDASNPDATETVESKEVRLKDDAVKTPNGVAYDRLSVMLLSIIQRQEQRISDLEARLAALEGGA